MSERRKALTLSAKHKVTPFLKTAKRSLSFGSYGDTKAHAHSNGKLVGNGEPAIMSRTDERSEGSSSEDESGGTIKRMPKLRHVSVRRSITVDEDDEPPYSQLFEFVFVVEMKTDSKGGLKTEISYTFPPGLQLQGKNAGLQSIPEFCFPDIDQWKPTTSYKSETFSFVLTDIEGNRRFGYCRRLLPAGKGPRLPETYVIISPLGCFSVYEKILDHVERRRAVSTTVNVFMFLKTIVVNAFPKPGQTVKVKCLNSEQSGMEVMSLERLPDSRLEHVDFSILFSALSSRKIIKVFSSLLLERRVILCAQSLTLLTSCAHALIALLYPMEWQHVLIPVLPASLIEFVCSPLPYIIGINPSCIKRLEGLEMEEALVVDLEKRKFVKKVGDESSILPSKLFLYLENCLDSTVSEYSKRTSGSASKADEVVVKSFMAFFVYLFGNYHKYMEKDLKGPGFRLQRKEFEQSFTSKSTQRFLRAFFMTQMFDTFIEERENPLKAERVSQGLFEKLIPQLKEQCQEIEQFSSSSRRHKWIRGLTRRK